MATFIAFDPKVEVNGRTILSVIEAMPEGREIRAEILAHHGLYPLEADGWYSQQKWLNAYKEVATLLGENTLFMIGKAIPNNADFPPNVDNLYSALQSINVAYHFNHRCGEIGYYRLIHFDADEAHARMECYTPYHSDFDRGIISAMVERFRPETSLNYKVGLDPHRPNRKEGADSCFYDMYW